MSTVFTNTTISTTTTDKLRALPDEYEYGFEAHFDEGEAVDRYHRERRNNPGGLVVIEDLPCGHFEVKVLKTEREKQTYYRKTLAGVFAEFWRTLTT